MPEHWFIADTHFGAKSLNTDFRGFSTSEEADEVFIEGIHKYVKRGDICWVIGDFAENPTKYRMRLPRADWRIILGNHDPKNAALNSFGKSRTHEQLTYRIGNDTVFMSHYPAVFWDKSHRGSYHVYGHCHGQREDYLNSLLPDRRSMDVGVDVAKQKVHEYRPFNWEEILFLLRDRAGHDQPEFYQLLDIEKARKNNASDQNN